VEERHKRLQSGAELHRKEGSRFLKDYQIECEECDESSYVASYQEPVFCPICGRRAEAEEVQSMEKD
tara:strand:+ start:204 stop:404 length:201 start_codon:yes stop_codon:yes gene_type:complete